MSTYQRTNSNSNAVTLKRTNSGLRKIKMEVGNSPGRIIITFPYPVSNGKYYELPTYQLKVSGINNSGIFIEKSWEVYRFGIYNNDGSDHHYNSRGLFVAGLASKQTHIISYFDPDYTVHSARSNEKGAWKVTKSFLIHDGPDIPVTKEKPSVGSLYASIGCIEICGGPAGFDKFNDFIISLSGSTKSRLEALKEIALKKLITIDYLEATRPPLKEYIP